VKVSPLEAQTKLQSEFEGTFLQKFSVYFNHQHLQVVSGNGIYLIKVGVKVVPSPFIWAPDIETSYSFLQGIPPTIAMG